MQNKLTIKAWAEEDRPREKLLSKGTRSLTDSELIALLIGSGNREETAVELARRILQKIDNNLNELGKKTIPDLRKFKGIGQAKAISIVAALELGRRVKKTDQVKRMEVVSSKTAFQCMEDLLCDLNHEEFWIVLLNRSNKVIDRINISKGGVSSTTVDAKIIFKTALELLASAVILYHNHPSGNLKPSEADKQLTKKNTGCW